jgi:hypothetical protein
MFRTHNTSFSSPANSNATKAWSAPDDEDPQGNGYLYLAESPICVFSASNPIGYPCGVNLTGL